MKPAPLLHVLSLFSLCMSHGLAEGDGMMSKDEIKRVEAIVLGQMPSAFRHDLMKRFTGLTEGQAKEPFPFEVRLSLWGQVPKGKIMVKSEEIRETLLFPPRFPVILFLNTDGGDPPGIYRLAATSNAWLVAYGFENITVNFQKATATVATNVLVERLLGQLGNSEAFGNVVKRYRENYGMSEEKAVQMANDVHRQAAIKLLMQAKALKLNSPAARKAYAELTRERDEEIRKLAEEMLEGTQE